MTAAVVGIVADLTGYPADLLDLDLDLEADLGVDTVKQAEVFAAVRTHWDLERDDTLQLREFPTLNHVAGWVRTKLGTSTDAPAASVTPAAGATDPAAAAAPHTVLGDLDAVAHDYFSSADFDRLLVETVQATFPAHEHEQFVAHYRGLLGAWVADAARAG